MLDPTGRVEIVGVMMTMSFRLLRLPTTALLALLGLATVGCSSGTSAVRVTSLQTKQQYAQDFQEGYARNNAAGDVDVVVTKECRPMIGAAARGSERTTASAAANGEVRNLRHVLHVRVLWQPMKGTKTDSPTATNATMSWYVFDDSRQPRMIEYSGAAFVEVERKSGQTLLTVRNATLRPTTRIGDLTDPIGPAKIDGKIVAQNDRIRVENLLSETRATIDVAQASGRLLSQKNASSRLPAD
jgi:hypothetical protein